MSENTSVTVSEIFGLLRNGHQREGVDLLYQNCYNKMYGIAFSIVKREDASQDIVHNVVCRLLSLETKKFPSSNELTWLYTVVKNETFMFLRKQKPNVSLEGAAVEPIVENKDIRDFVDMDAFFSMIKGLNEEQCRVVTLKVLGGYTHKEIAKMLNKPIGTIQWIYNTSVKKLRIALSSIMIAVVLSGIGFIERLVSYVSQTSAVPELPGHTVHIPFDPSIIVFAVLFVVLSTVFWLIFLNSHKFPTKADRKNI